MRRNSNHVSARSALAMAAVLVIPAAFVAPRLPAGASAETSTSTRKLLASYEQQPVTIGAPVCSPTNSCVVPFSLVGVSTGDLNGIGPQAGAASRLADGSIYANSTLKFTGTVVGCGIGTVIMRSTGFNRAGVTSGSIEIIEGSGTAGLSSLSGTGTVVSGEVDPATGIGRGEIEYRVKC